jgi:hypothetical protein
VVIKVERGNPTPEELAAVVALVQARAVAASTVAGGPHSLDEWADPARNVPQPVLRATPGSWRATYWPR